MASPPELETVKEVDLARYSGTWYEIARYPAWFQKGCFNSKATYTLRKDGKLDVLNECNEDAPDGELDKADGTAWVPDKKEPAKLKVSFFWPFRSAYWIIERRQRLAGADAAETENDDAPTETEETTDDDADRDGDR